MGGAPIAAVRGLRRGAGISVRFIADSNANLVGATV